VRALAGEGRRFGLVPGACRALVGPPSLAALLPEHARDATIGSYLGVPVPLRDGRRGAVLCAFRAHAEPTWGRRDRRLATVLGELVADELELESERLHQAETIRASFVGRELPMVFQPAFELGSGELVAYEALARFPDEPTRPTAAWFAVADELGIGVELELAAVEAALAQLDNLPAGVLLSLNISPAAAIAPEFADLVAPVAERLVIELTEHTSIDDYGPLGTVLARLRARGAKLAVDDVGAGYASLRHILHLAPDIVKLDLSLTRDIDSDSSRRALTSALVDFAYGMGATMAAEGIESEGEFALLRELGVSQGQGYYLGRPAELAEQLH